MNNSSEFKVTSVSGDWSDKVFECFLNGQHWNGWACPFFTIDNAKLVAEVIGELAYDEEKDVFVWTDEGSRETEVFAAVVIEVNGEKVKTYPIGAWSWCWTFE